MLANGRDPYFPAWPDVVQLNAFAPALREAAVATLRDIADQCDGVRCDMAMLMMNDVFAKTWGSRAGDAPADGLLADRHRRGPRNGTRASCSSPRPTGTSSGTLQQQGFDYCYDKRLYDRLVHGRRRGGAPAPARRRRLPDSGCVRFVENHDEPRAASIVRRPAPSGGRRRRRSPRPGRASSTTASTRAGAPTCPSSWAASPTSRSTRSWSRSTTRSWPPSRDPTFRDGAWRLCERTGWPGNDGAEAICRRGAGTATKSAG